MSRRHNSSRRKSYGRRQHEIRERRPRAPERDDWSAGRAIDDWLVIEADDERQPRPTGDSFGGNAL